jgi:hypothetical protein
VTLVAGGKLPSLHVRSANFTRLSDDHTIMTLTGRFPLGAVTVSRDVDHIDTAQYDGPGVVNELIPEALSPSRRPGDRHQGRRSARRERCGVAP